MHPDRKTQTVLKTSLVLAVTGLIGAVVYFTPVRMVVRASFDPESIRNLAGYLRSFEPWTPLVSLAIMIIQAVIAPLPGSLVAAVNGLLYGLWWGGLLSWIGSILGSGASFWLARLLGQELLRRRIKVTYWEQIDRLSAAHGFSIVLIARLTPLISLDHIGYLAGLSQMRFDHYLLASAIGLLPGMIAYTMLGHDLARAQFVVWRLSLVLVIGLLVFIGGRRWLRQRGLH